LGFSLHSDRVYSAGNDGCFKVHDLQTRKHIRTWEADRPYYRLSPHPTDDNVISIACSDGNVYIYDIRQPDGNTHLQLGGEVFSVTYNHVQPNLLAVCSRPAGLTIYDLRKTQDHYVRAGEFTKRAFYSDWSENGDGIFCAVSQSSPYYFNLNTSDYVQMDDPGYINVCTVKSCTVAGNYALVGGDDWNIYVWKIPTDPSERKKVEEAYTVLKGHRSVVNHVRYSQSSQMLISCGVEKIIKCWSMFPLCDAVRNPKRRQRGRPIDLLAAMHTYDSGDLCPEEDLYTLYQFDQYYEAAIRKPRYDSDESDDDSLESFAYDYLSHYVADFDSDESMSSEVPDIDLTDNIGIDDLFTNMS
jgi:WD repeat-containing protein 22